MPKIILNPLGNFNSAALTTLNNNFEAIEDAIENTLSRDGTTPNQMTADLDMNGNDILNIGSLSLKNGDTLKELVERAEQAADDAEAAAVHVEDFNQRYLGPFANDAAANAYIGTPAAGMLYFNTSTNVMRVYSTSWNDLQSAVNTNYQTFTGNGSQTDFALSADPGSVNNLRVLVDYVSQAPTTNYNLTYPSSVPTLSFTSGPANTAPIHVWYGSALQVGVPSDGSVSTSKLLDDSVTYQKLQNISAQFRVLGRNSSGAGDAQEVTFTQFLDWVGSAAQGDILYRGSSSWTRLAAGTSGHFLKTNGAAANPEWAAPAGGSVISSVSVKTADYTVLAVDAGVLLVLDSATARTFTLPALSGVSDGALYMFKNEDTGLLTIQRTGSDTIETEGYQSFKLSTGQGAILTKANGVWKEWPGRGGIPFRDEVSLYTSNAYGSSATKIVRFTTVAQNAGSSLTLTQSAANGDSVTVNVTGLYFVQAEVPSSDADREYGITVNQSNLTDSIGSVTATQVLAADSGTGSRRTNCATLTYLAAGDVIRVCTDAGTLVTTAGHGRFRVVRVA